MSSRNKQEQLQVDDDWGQDLPDISQVDLDDDHEALAMDHTLMNPDISSDRRYVLTELAFSQNKKIRKFLLPSTGFFRCKSTPNPR